MDVFQVYIMSSSKEEKFAALSNIYGAISIGQSMIFCHVSSNLGDAPYYLNSRETYMRL